MADAKISADSTVTPARADLVPILQGGANANATAGSIADLMGNLTTGVNSASPNATVPVVSLTATNAATNVDVAIAPKGAGGIAAQIADSSTTGGNKRGANAVDWQTKRTSSAARVASGANSTISGGTNNTASGSASTVSGGNTNQATSTNSTVSGGANNIASTNSASTVGGGGSNTASGGNSTVGGGTNNVASGGSTSATTVAGGDTNTASNDGAAVGGGLQNTASGQYSTVPGGEQNTATGKHGFAFGAYAADRGIVGAIAHSPALTIGSTVGDLQSMALELAKQTTTATPAVLVSNTSAASTDNQLLLPANSAYIVKGLVVARQNTTGATASWEFTAHIRQGANAAATAMVATCTPTLIAADSGASTWSITVTADTTNGALALTVTGEASKTIRWGAYLRSMQVVG